MQLPKRELNKTHLSLGTIGYIQSCMGGMSSAVWDDYGKKEAISKGGEKLYNVIGGIRNVDFPEIMDVVQSKFFIDVAMWSSSQFRSHPYNIFPF